MAHVSRLSDYVAGGVVVHPAGIYEGSFVTATVSGGRALSSLPNVNIAASGTVYPVYVVFAAPDNFPRPVNELNYTANYQVTIRGDVNTGWADPIDRYTMYREGISSLENPLLLSGMRVQLHRGGTYTLTSGNYIDVPGIRVKDALIRVAHDGTGRAQLTTVLTEAVAFVEEYDATRGYLTITLKQ